MQRFVKTLHLRNLYQDGGILGHVRRGSRQLRFDQNAAVGDMRYRTMTTETIDLASLTTVLTNQPSRAGNGDLADAAAEHPLARELRMVLANPGPHRIGDLARVVEQIRREMTMFKAAHGLQDDRDG
jgi:hypothetical protein